MRRTTERYEMNRLPGWMGGPPHEPIGAFQFDHIRVIAGNGSGWDHVSVSTDRRTPIWDEMCRIKDLFFYPQEIAMQLHVSESDHRNLHPYCLHLWRPQTGPEIVAASAQWKRLGLDTSAVEEFGYTVIPDQKIPLPPGWMVAPLIRE